MNKIRAAAARRRLAWAIALVASLFVLAGPMPAQAANNATQILRVPLDFSVFLPCANGGIGEIVNLSGTFIDRSHVTFDQSGGFHLYLLETLSGVSGTGETTGDRYVSMRVNMFDFNQGSASLPITSTQELMFRITGQGPGNDALIRIRNHSTVNADGTVTVAFDTFTAECEPTTP